jgi:hypothetical protein
MFSHSRLLKNLFLTNFMFVRKCTGTFLPVPLVLKKAKSSLSDGGTSGSASSSERLPFDLMLFTTALMLFKRLLS